MKKNYVVKLETIEDYHEFKEKFDFKDKDVKGFSTGLEGEFVFKIKKFGKTYYFHNDIYHLNFFQSFIENRVNLTVEEAKSLLIQ